MRGPCDQLKDRLTRLKTELARSSREDLAPQILGTPPLRERLVHDINDTQRALDSCIDNFRVMGYVQQQRRQGLR